MPRFLWVAFPLMVLASAPTGAAQVPEKELVLTITGKQLKNGVVSEITWDGGTLVIQGVFADPAGKLAAQYFVKPAESVALQTWPEHSPASLKYWQTKSSRTSPTGLGRIALATDAKVPMYGIGSLQERMGADAALGGTVTTHLLKLFDLLLHERISPAPPYDGEVWSWSPLELNRVAYVDGRGDLWVAHADGRSPQRLARGNFTLPAWSDDGRLIAVAERTRDRWEVSVIHVPTAFRQPWR